MEMQALIDRALDIRARYSTLEKKKHGREWTREETLLGLVGDVGDLSKLILAKEGVREIADVDQRLAHELSDCLWCILVLANKYGVDIEQAFLRTMDELEERIGKENEV